MSGGGRPVVFGEVLFDRFEDGSEVLGGAPFNVAWNLRGFGLDPLLVSRVGDDDPGRRILAAMQDFGLDSSAVQVDPDHATGAVEVHVVDDEPSFDIVTDSAWDFIENPPAAVELTPTLLYHGSLALRSPVSARTAGQLLARAGSAPVFFDVNLRPPWWDARAVSALLGSAHSIKLNREELGLLAPGGHDPATRAHDLLESSGATNVVVTLGAEGAFAVTRGDRRASTRPRSQTPVVDTVGAGDAFSSVLILGLLEGWSLPRMLDRAREFAEAVVGLRGATTTDPEFYSRSRATWSPA